MNGRVLVIIPAYNEQSSILNVIKEIENVKHSKNDFSIDYIVINDCSVDSTLDILKDNKKNYLSLPLNLGIGGGMQTGYRYAFENGYDVAIQVDGDGQHDAQFIERLARAVLNEGFDLCIGSRFIEKKGFQSTGLRRIGISWLSLMIRLTCGIKVYDVTSGFRAAGKRAIETFALDYAQDYPEPESIVLCAKKKMNIKEVPVIMKERQGGVSSISPIKSIYYMLKVTLAIVFAGI